MGQSNSLHKYGPPGITYKSSVVSSSKAYKPSYLSNNSQQNQQHHYKTPNYSHVHDSLDHGEADQAYDNLGEEILIRDNVQVPDPSDLGFERRFGHTP